MLACYDLSQLNLDTLDNIEQVKDEIHFLFCCHTYSSIRDDFYNKIYNRLPNFKQLSLNELILKLMNSEDCFNDKLRSRGIPGQE